MATAGDFMSTPEPGWPNSGDFMNTPEPGWPNPGDFMNTPEPGWGERVVPGVAPGAMPKPIPEPKITTTTINGDRNLKDLRARIMVPPSYLTPKTVGMMNELGVSNIHGIIFPYTPIISVDYKADYTTANLLHSNFSVNFYQKSSIGSISIQGKFSVENVRDAAVYIATVRLLKALTRMRSGGYTGDPDSGSPPPVCRLFAYGNWMFNNVPVAIQTFRVELPDSVDYFTMPENNVYEETAVPTMSTLSITCLPMYSRNEMLKYNVTEYLSGNSDYNSKGYL